MPAILRSSVPKTVGPQVWLLLAWRDFRTKPLLSLSYGATFLVAGIVICLVLWSAGLSELIPAAAAGFALVGPVLAGGLYEMSRKVERRLPVEFSDLFGLSWLREGTCIMGVMLMFAVLVWMKIASLLVTLFFAPEQLDLAELTRLALTTPDGHTFVTAGTLVGGILATAIFAVSAFSIPMMLDRDIDALTAMGESVKIVISHPFLSIIWAACIAAAIAVVIATAFIGFIVVFPILGHASWHAYRSLARP
jgi:uncharacterized membrane protein